MTLAQRIERSRRANAARWSKARPPPKFILRCLACDRVIDKVPGASWVRYAKRRYCSCECANGSLAGFYRRQRRPPDPTPAEIAERRAVIDAKKEARLRCAKNKP